MVDMLPCDPPGVSCAALRSAPTRTCTHQHHQLPPQGLTIWCVPRVSDKIAQLTRARVIAALEACCRPTQVHVLGTLGASTGAYCTGQMALCMVGGGGECLLDCPPYVCMLFSAAALMVPLLAL